MLPLTIVNHTYRYANSAIYVYIVGTDLASGQQVYVRADGTRVPVSPSLNGPDGFADLSIPLAADGDTHLTLPWMSGRIYVSIGAKVRFKVVTDGNGRPALQHPAGWVSSDANYSVLHDFMEFTFTDAGMFCNTTMVDMFSIPMALRLDGQASQTIGTLVTNGRDNIFAAIAANADFRSLILGNNLRVIAPGHGINAGLFPAGYLDSYVNEVWNRYASTDLRVRIGGTTHTGRVSGGQLAFNNGIRAFARPTTRDVFFCDGALNAGGPSGPIAAILGAAFNRSTLRDHADQPTTDPGTFYRTPISNHYARVLHENTVDGKAYGFAFDDVVSFASYVEDHTPTSMTLRLTPFGPQAPGPGPSPTPPGGAVNAYATIQAESFNAQSGTQTEACQDSGGGSDVGYIANGDWLRYNQVDFGSAPATQFQARVASGAAAGVSGLVQVRLDNPTTAPVGSFAIANTGGWQSWRTVPASIAGVTGVHTVYVTFASGQPADFVNLNWLTFSR
ncbi:hypothetical protein Prum_095100 [Phytohabitans rumicis]|uniref:Uncharacterized protein n=1 Tax=Phytohabitans rumicis TaxID=1076125 RepID=A0A6V8LLZ4_9ACTN|nr:hypothetical protein Prum_095100 [Phytohabitans rumicis]